MRRVCLNRTIGILVVSLLVAVSVYGQQGQQPTSEPAGAKASANAESAHATKPKSDSADPYVFPTHRERFNRYVEDTVGPFRLARTAAAAGIDQWRDTPDEWEQGMKGYGKRFASSFGRNAIQQSVTFGLDEALGQDTGFHRSSRDGVLPRVKHAFLETITSRTKSGRRVISAPRLAGVYAGAIVATETWYPERYSYKDGLRLGTGTLLTNFGINLVREFFIDW
jgi:hypothetical protein